MRFELISINGKVLETEDFISATVSTDDGQIMILPNHEPIMSAIVPGVFMVTYGRKHIYTPNFVIGGGVLHVTPDTCRIIADLVENEDNLTNEEYILAQKKEAEELKNAFILEGKSVDDPTKLIELEYELLKFTAMHQLMMKKKNNQTV